MKDTFIPIFQPKDPIQAGLIKETFEEAEINFYINNENISSMRFVGMRIGAGDMIVFVQEAFVEQAQELISSLGIE